MKNQLTFLLSILFLILLKPCSAQFWNSIGPNGANIINVKSTSSYLVSASRSSPGGLWKSNDNGTTWTDIMPNLPSRSIYNMFTDGDTLLISVTSDYNQSNGGFFRSTDNGIVWNLFDATEYITSYLRKNSVLFEGTSSGINRSFNNGQTWGLTYGGQAAGFRRKVQCFESIGDTIFIGTQRGVYRSTDNCTTWVPKYTGIPTTSTPNGPGYLGYITGLCKTGDVLFAGTYQQGVYKSTNRGDSWVEINTGLTNLQIQSIYASNNTLFVGTLLGGVFKSNDGGTSWTPVNQVLTGEAVYCFFQNGSKLFAGGQDGIYATSDAGNNWTETNTGIVGQMITKTIKNNGYLFTISTSGRIFRSADNGNTWQPITAKLGQLGRISIDAMEATNNVLLVKIRFSDTGGGAFYSTSDGGENWIAVTSFPYYGYAAPGNLYEFDNRFYATDYVGVLYYSDDNALTWVEDTRIVNCGFGGKMCKKGNDLFINGSSSLDPLGPNKIYSCNIETPEFTFIHEFTYSVEKIIAVGDTLFVCTTDYNASSNIIYIVYKSGDRGATWTIDKNLGTEQLLSFATDGNRLFTRTKSNNIYTRRDDGLWVNINFNAPFDNTQGWNALGMDPIDETLYLGVTSHSLYKTSLAKFNIPAQPSAIIGSLTPCQGTVQTYYVTNIQGVTYTWAVPSNWVILSGQGTNSITIITIPGAANGNITVTPNNFMGNGPAQSLFASPTTTAPAQPSVIAGLTNPLEGSSQTYSVTNDPGVTYAWTFPLGWIQTSGGTTNSITVIVGSGAGNITVTPSTPCGTGTSRFLAVVPSSNNKTLTLTALSLEGLYAGSGTLRQAYDNMGPHFPAGVADQITVELHDAANYATIIYTASAVNLSTTGTASVTIPSTFTGSYYITIRHRNSLQTVSATAKSFAGSTITQSFGTPADVFGGNLVQMANLGYAIYGGDVNQDGIVDGSDFTMVDNLAAQASSGYLPEDVNGDGLIDGSDFAIIDNIASQAIGAVTP